jgi:hypothetical protein
VIFELFSSSKLDEFAKHLAQDIARRYPPAFANNPDQIVSQQRVAEILEEVLAQAHQFRGENRLGVLRRAKLGNTFKWALREIGYDEEFIELATGKLTTSLTGRQP